MTGHSGNCNRTRTYTLVVLPKPNINIAAVPPVICNGSSGLLLALGATNYTWSPMGTNGNTLIIAPNVTTTYTVTGTNPAGCSNTAVTTVTVNPTPTITTIPSATQVCSGTSVTITSNGAITYVAQPGTQTGSVIVVTPTATTSYTITGVNIFGCTDSKVVTVSVLPNPTITAQSSGTLLCDGGSFSLSATGATNYTWIPLSTNGSSVVTTATSSINSYTLLGESNGCTSKTVIAVQVINCNNTIFGITKAAGTPTLVYNEFFNVTFSITAVNVSSLNLTNITLNEDLATAFPAPAVFTLINQPIITSHNSSLVINPLFDGVSQLSLTSPLTSTLLAGKRDTIVFTIRIDPKQFFGPYKNSVIGFADFLNSFTVADSSNDGFAWDPDQDGDPTNNDIPTIINLPYSELFIPNGFSPDDDGKNDFFVIKGLNGRKVKLTIFNRWGNKVYEKSEYDNSWNAVVNTGGITLGNNKVPPSTYYYILEFLDGDKETRTGFVVIQY
ncbi:MAG: gliding motility-associated C-terminal domain-containing protein [Bacteroidia bacterium]